MNYVYLISGLDEFGICPSAPTKIGVSNNPFLREASIKTGSPLEVHLVCIHRAADRSSALEIERALHEKFSEVRTVGEWFDVCPLDILAEINSSFPTELIREPLMWGRYG